MDVTGWPHGLDTLDFKDADSIGFSIAGGESVTRGYTRFSCHGIVRCEVQILREGVLGDSFDITTEGSVTAGLDTEIYARALANAAYDGIKIDNVTYYDDRLDPPDRNRVYPSNHFSRRRRDRENNRVLIDGKNIPFSGNIESRQGWTGHKYELTDNGKVYEGYMHIDDPDPANAKYNYYGYWTRKDSIGNLEEIRAFAVPNNSRTTPNNGVPNLDPLTGTATYVGEAVGYFALKGSNPDSGSFTATTTLEANFDTDKIKGTVNNFSGPTNGSRWSIELKEIGFTNTNNYNRGYINNNAEAVWTIDGVEGDSDGVWDGQMAGTDSGFPEAVLGVFYSEHSGANGVITGGFVVEKQ